MSNVVYIQATSSNISGDQNPNSPSPEFFQCFDSVILGFITPGQSYNETRVDMEASIAGNGTEDLVVTEVIKPIIRYVMRDSQGEYTQVVQRGVVVVERRVKN